MGLLCGCNLGYEVESCTGGGGLEEGTAGRDRMRGGKGGGGVSRLEVRREVEGTRKMAARTRVPWFLFSVRDLYVLTTWQYPPLPPYNTHPRPIFRHHKSNQTVEMPPGML
eukprot:751644-Hanusia_phi.AAC.2